MDPRWNQIAEFIISQNWRLPLDGQPLAVRPCPVGYNLGGALTEPKIAFFQAGHLVAALRLDEFIGRFPECLEDPQNAVQFGPSSF